MSELSSDDGLPSVDPLCIDKAIAAGTTPVIQFWKPNYTPEFLMKINELCHTHGPKLGVRFYGHYHGTFDASVLKWLPSVQNLLVDCLNEIINAEHIGQLQQLRRFSFGVATFGQSDFLHSINLSQIVLLRLTEMARCNFDLRPLTLAKNLRQIYLEGHRRSIESLAGLPLLESLHLSSMPKAQSLTFVRDIKSARLLRLTLGGRDNLDDLSHDALAFLDVARVRGLSDLGSIRRFSNLIGLSVSDQIKLRRIDLQGASLKFLSIDNCKTLTEIASLNTQLELTELSLVRTAVQLDDFPDRQWPPSLRTVRLFSKYAKWNAAMKERLNAKGYSEQSQRWHNYDLNVIAPAGISKHS